MVKRILVCAALLIPSAAFADGGAPGDLPDDPEKDLCFDIGQNKFKCELLPQCFWDTSDQRCEWVFDPHACASIFDPGTCNAIPVCFWDSSDQRCERLF